MWRNRTSIVRDDF